MNSPTTQLLTDTWVPATWDEYLQQIEDPACSKAKGYYHNGKMRIEMAPLGSDHSRDHRIIAPTVKLGLTMPNPMCPITSGKMLTLFLGELML